MAMPADAAFVVDAARAGVLDRPSGAVREALERIRAAEAGTASPERLAELDRRIAAETARADSARKLAGT